MCCLHKQLKTCFFILLQHVVDKYHQQRLWHILYDKNGFKHLQYILARCRWQKIWQKHVLKSDVLVNKVIFVCAFLHKKWKKSHIWSFLWIVCLLHVGEVGKTLNTLSPSPPSRKVSHFVSKMMKIFIDCQFLSYSNQS